MENSEGKEKNGQRNSVDRNLNSSRGMMNRRPTSRERYSSLDPIRNPYLSAARNLNYSSLISSDKEVASNPILRGILNKNSDDSEKILKDDNIHQLRNRHRTSESAEKYEKNDFNEENLKDLVPSNKLILINRQLHEDLKNLMDQFMDLFLAHQRLQSSHQKMTEDYEIRLEKLIEESEVNHIEIKALKNQISEKERNEETIKVDYEFRLQRLREDLAEEREERAQLFELNAKMKTQILELTQANETKSTNSEYKEKVEHIQKITELQSELDYCKTLLLERRLKIDEEGSLRTELSQSTRRKCIYGRIHYVGTPKPFQEMLIILEKLDSHPIRSKERLLALEDLCVFINSSDEELERIRSFKVAIHAVKSLSSSHAAIVLRALHLLSCLCVGNMKSCEQVVENGGIITIRDFLDSPDENIRVESLACLQAISNFQEFSTSLNKAGLISRAIILLEEGLQLDNDYGNQTSMLCLKILNNLSRGNVGVKEIQSQGGLFSILRCLSVPHPYIQKIAISCLRNCAKIKDHQRYIVELKSIKLLLDLINHVDLDISKDAAETLLSICSHPQVQEDIRLESGIEKILESFKYADDDLIIVLLKVLVSLSENEAAALRLCQNDYLGNIADFMKKKNLDVRRLAAESLDKITNSGISIDFVFNNTTIQKIIDNLDYQIDTETAKICFKILYTFMTSEYPRSKIFEQFDYILPQIIKFLGSRLSLNDLGEVLKVMPLLACDNTIRVKILNEKLDISMARILKKRFDFTEEIDNTVVIDLITFFSAVIEEEYHTLKNIDKPIILKECIEFENLLEILMKILEGYIQLNKIDWNIINVTIHCLEVLSFSTSYKKELIELNLINSIMKTIQIAEEMGQSQTVNACISLLAFYTYYEQYWLTIVRPQVIKILASRLISNDMFMAARAKACLYDLSFCPLAAHVFCELSPEEGMKALIEAYEVDKSDILLILQNFCQDISFKTKFKSCLPHKLILMGQGKNTNEFDFLNQVLPKSDSSKKTILYSTDELMEQGYLRAANFYQDRKKIYSSLQTMPPLPKDSGSGNQYKRMRKDSDRNTQKNYYSAQNSYNAFNMRVLDKPMNPYDSASNADIVYYDPNNQSRAGSSGLADDESNPDYDRIKNDTKGSKPLIQPPQLGGDFRMNRDKLVISQEKFLTRNLEQKIPQTKAPEKKTLNEVLKKQIFEDLPIEERKRRALDEEKSKNPKEPNTSVQGLNPDDPKIIYQLDKDPNKEFYNDNDTLKQIKQFNQDNPLYQTVQEKALEQKLKEQLEKKNQNAVQAGNKTKPLDSQQQLQQQQQQSDSKLIPQNNQNNQPIETQNSLKNKNLNPNNPPQVNSSQYDPTERGSEYTESFLNNLKK